MIGAVPFFPVVPVVRKLREVWLVSIDRIRQAYERRRRDESFEVSDKKECLSGLVITTLKHRTLNSNDIPLKKDICDAATPGISALQRCIRGQRVGVLANQWSCRQSIGSDQIGAH